MHDVDWEIGCRPQYRPTRGWWILPACVFGILSWLAPVAAIAARLG